MMAPPEPKLSTTVLVVGAGKALVVAWDFQPHDEALHQGSGHITLIDYD